MKVLTEAVRGRSRLTCPYHGWTCALDGRLVRAPHFDEPGRHGVTPVDGPARVRSDVWHRLVFINLSGELQDAFATTAFDGGCLSPGLDSNIRHFHRLIAEHTRA